MCGRYKITKPVTKTVDLVKTNIEVEDADNFRHCAGEQNTAARFGQFANAFDSIVSTLAGITTELRLLQPQNAHCSILVTLPGITTELRMLHLLNANSPITVTPAGMSTCAS